MLETKCIEDLLELLAGLHKSKSDFKIETSDGTIVTSIARQVFRGTALTDRQQALMKIKLQAYKQQFLDQGYEFDFAIEGLRQPLRTIDRSKYIRLEDNWIKIRFPFSKSLIQTINELPKRHDEYKHAKGSHEHYFTANESNIYRILNSFKNKEFEIDNTLLEYYDKCNKIIEDKNNLVSYIDDNGLHNVSDKIVEKLENDLGSFSENKIKYIDRYRRYGINEVRSAIFPSDTIQKIIARKSVEFYCPEKEYALNDVLLGLYNLDRFPLLVNVQQGQELDQVYAVYDFFRTLLPAQQQSVMFRLDNENNKDFNRFVKDKKLNNWVDKSTKIVYINNKLTKVLIKSEFIPITTLMFSHATNGQMSKYIKSKSDLVVIRAEESYMRKYSTYHGYM